MTEVDNALLERFEQEVWSKVPHLEEKDGETKVVNATPLVDITEDFKECAKTIFKLNLDDPIQDNADSLHRIFSPNVLGVVVNIANTHWVAYRFINEQIWFLDSEKVPVRQSFAQYRAFLRKHRNKFAIEHILH